MKGKKSKDDFEFLLKETRRHLEGLLPILQDSSFASACQGVADATQALAAAHQVLKKLQEQTDPPAAPDLMQAAQKAVDLAQTCLQDAQRLCQQTVLPVVQAVQKWFAEKSQKNMILFVVVAAIVAQGTPQGWADEYVNHPEANDMYDAFFQDHTLMHAFVSAGGASKAKYGAAIRIYNQLAFMVKPEDSMGHRLALAVALRLADPIAHFADPSTTVDPVARFQHYQQAFAKDELDPAFEAFSVWELRHVVDSDARDTELQWGRDFLKAYRPDFVLRSDKWRYCRAVRSDVGYRHPDGPSKTYMDVLSNGGECGPRAWFGRFVCKAFGIPTWGVRQPGHAAMSRWFDGEWVMCLGREMDFSWWEDNRPGAASRSNRKGPDFVLEFQARKHEDYFSVVAIMDCLASIFGNQPWLEHVDPKYLWRSAALMARNHLASTVQQENQPAAVRQDLPDGQCSLPRAMSVAIPLAKEDGTFVIPAASFSSPEKPGGNVLILPSFLEPDQNELHLEKDGSVAYTMSSSLPEGIYSLTCRYVNVHHMQVPLMLTIEEPNPDDPVQVESIPLDYTIGEWKMSAPVVVSLSPGSVLKVEREAPCYGLSIQDFLLTPVTSCRNDVHRECKDN